MGEFGEVKDKASRVLGADGSIFGAGSEVRWEKTLEKEAEKNPCCMKTYRSVDIGWASRGTFLESDQDPIQSGQGSLRSVVSVSGTKAHVNVPAQVHKTSLGSWTKIKYIIVQHLDCWIFLQIYCCQSSVRFKKKKQAKKNIHAFYK